MMKDNPPEDTQSAEDKRRNKPCENCRAHRRKCVVVSGDHCERCIKNNVACVFLVVSKPKLAAKKAISQSKKRRLLNQVYDLEDICEDLEDQLRTMDIKFDSSSSSSSPSIKTEDSDDQAVTFYEPPQSDTPRSAETELVGYSKPSQPFANICTCTTSTPCSHMKINTHSTTPEWNLTISREQQGLRFQTSIKTIEDIILFTVESLKYFNMASDVPRPPLYYSEQRQGQLQVTLKRLDGEEVVAQLIKHSRRQRPVDIDSLRPIFESALYTAITEKLLQNYFECVNLTYALVHEKHFYQHIRKHPECMMVPAICAFMMVNQCQHVKLDMISPAIRKDLELHFVSQARSSLEEVLFEHKPTLESIATMTYLAQYNLIAMNGNEAWLQMGTAWQMAMDVKPEYLAILKNPHKYSQEQQMDAESWKRLYYYIRYVEVNLYTVFQPTSNFLSLIDDCGLGYPKMNDHDMRDDDHINAFIVLDALVKISVQHLEDSNDNILYALFRGTMETVSQALVEKMEHFMFHWWKALPARFQIGSSPIEYLPQKNIDACQIPQVLMLNNTYHLFWMAFECRLMRDPRDADLAGTSLHFSNSDRALAIVSMCCDAIARCTEALYRLAPCKIDPPYIIIVIDVMSRLQEAADKKIATVARTNLELTMQILQSIMHALTEKGTTNLGVLDKSDNPPDGRLGQFLERLANLHTNSTPCT